jgi:hypothetical protein
LCYYCCYVVGAHFVENKNHVNMCHVVVGVLHVFGAHCVANACCIPKSVCHVIGVHYVVIYVHHVASARCIVIGVCHVVGVQCVVASAHHFC